MPGVIVALIILIIVALLIAVSCVKIVPQATACVVERLGGYLATWSVGIHFKAPFIDRVAKRVVLKEQGVSAVRLGCMKDQNARVIKNGEETRYLDRPAADELARWWKEHA